MKMVQINELLIVTLTLFVYIGKADAQEKLLLTVLYESECPDSSNFIIRQLLPTMNELHSYIDLKMVPFGKASNIEKQAFQCQHGPSECRGNVVQDCALDIIKQRSDLDKLNYVACEMDTYAASYGDMQCVKRHDIPLRQVERCASSNYGIGLQLDSEYQTKAVNPKFIPTITIDGVFDQRTQDRSLHNLMGTLCPLLNGIPPCDNYYGKVALRYQSIM